MRELNQEQLRRLYFDYITSGRTMPVREYFEKNKSKYIGSEKKMTDTQQKLDKLAEHVANLEAEVALLNNAVSAQPTLRDQFAMAALPECASEHRYSFDNGETVAREAYMFADAMLKEREK